MPVDPDSRTVPAINEFLDELRKGIESVEDIDGDTGRIYTCDVNLNDKKQARAADLSVAVNQDAHGKVVTGSYDPDKGHPLNATALLTGINAKRKVGRTLSGIRPRCSSLAREAEGQSTLRVEACHRPKSRLLS
jgi:hypothetical protein